MHTTTENYIRENLAPTAPTKRDTEREKQREELRKSLEGENILLVRPSFKDRQAFLENHKESGIKENELFETYLKDLFEEKKDIEESKTREKKIYPTSIEVIENIARYGTFIENQKPTIFEIKENKEENNFSCKIATVNYFQDPTGEKSKKLREKLDFINNSSKEEIREKKKEILNNDTFSEEGKAGLGYYEMGTRLKPLIEKPFTYTIERQKDGSTKFKLIITIPMEESLKKNQ